MQGKNIPFTPRTRGVAEQMVELEAAAVDPAASVQTAFPACARLQGPLSSFAGSAAFHAMLSRALSLAKKEFPRLGTFRLNRGGFVETFGTLEPPLTKEEATAGEAILLGNIVELLIALVGETLAHRLLQGVRPELTFADEASETEGKS